jgi:S1-C subfamily serine protease
MVKEKNSLINGINYQGKIFKFMLCFAVTLLMLGGLSFYKDVYGQNLNSSTLQGNSDNTINNIDTPLNASKESTLSSGKNFSSSLPDLFNYVKESVVQITDPANTKQQSDITGSRLGSGFVFDKNGHIITNYHVVEGAKNNKVYVTFLDGVSYEAEIRGTDPYADLAVIKILNLNPHNDALSKLVPLALGNSTNLKVGEKVVAVGNPFGLSGSLTEGIISGLGRLMPANTIQFIPPSQPYDLQNIPLNVPSFSIPDIIQTDAAINPGNSGGPLLNMKGQVIGINTAIFSNTGAYIGIGFSIPSNLLVKIIPTLIAGETYKHPYIGISGTEITPDIAKLMNLNESSGFLVVNVTKDSPASLAGIKGGNMTYQINGRPVDLGGDVIIKIDNKTVKKLDDILSYLENNKKIGSNVSLTIWRDGNESKVVPLTLTSRPDLNLSSVSPPSIGVIGLDVTPAIATLMNLSRNDGFLITGVLDQSPASKANLRGGYILSELNGTPIELGGDVIIKIDNKTVQNQQDIKKHLSAKIIGDTVVITIIRDGEQMAKNVILTEFEERPSIMDKENNNLLDPNPPLYNLPKAPNGILKDFLNSCYKMLDKEFCDSFLPNQ